MFNDEADVEKLRIFHVDEFHGSDIYQAQKSNFLGKRGMVSVVEAARSRLSQHLKVCGTREIYCSHQI